MELIISLEIGILKDILLFCDLFKLGNMFMNVEVCFEYYSLKSHWCFPLHMMCVNDSWISNLIRFILSFLV